MDPSASALVDVISLTVVVAWLLAGTYLSGAYVCWRIGTKLGVGSYGGYCIPIYSVFLMCRWIRISAWAAAWFYLPWLLASVLAGFAPASRSEPAWIAALLVVASIYAAFQLYFWGMVAERLGKSFWLYGITTIVFFGVPILFLAFDESTVALQTRAGITSYPADALLLYCVSGEMARSTLVIPGEGLYIGRNPSKANLILHSSQVSNVHARVWPARDARGIWLEDWNSLNGTYYCSLPGGDWTSRTRWRVLQGRIRLDPGARFRLGSKVAEFEVCV